MSKKNLTIIILTHNSADIIGNSLSRINQEKYDLTVVDNASSDETITIIKRDFSKVNLIKLPQNIGYGRANNVALKQVQTLSLWF